MSNLHKLINETRSIKGKVRFLAEIEHTGLGTIKVFNEPNTISLNSKIKAQFEVWDNQWNKEINTRSADHQTFNCQKELNEVQRILSDSLGGSFEIDWLKLKQVESFQIPHPQINFQAQLEKHQRPVKEALDLIPKEPLAESFKPRWNLLDRLFLSLRVDKLAKAELKFKNAIINWEHDLINARLNNGIKAENFNKKAISYNSQIERTKKAQALQTQIWEDELDAYYADQTSYNLNLKRVEDLYRLCDKSILAEYCTIALKTSKYPRFFLQDFDIEYRSDSNFLIIDFSIPSPEELPSLSEIRYIHAKGEFKQIHLSAIQQDKLYEDAIYNNVLRTVNELFRFDKNDLIESIVFNGWVNSLNKGTGKRVNTCIVSLQVKKSDFHEIDLWNIDPKTCFKNLKGIGSSKLSGIHAIQPIITLNKDDKRFVNSYEVANTLNEGLNLAAMGWEDFEHLIREIFQKEFSSNGGEVKVTQASHDGGVDAIAFDPDPIRGGKIVIQAKRYTNTVGVSAIRDLYGTVLNEGATKGILVTTSDFGPDAYEFIKNKPLTLLSGGHLLHLLEKHGHSARIDLQEAKRILKDASNVVNSN